jgi:hypothetical protein
MWTNDDTTHSNYGSNLQLRNDSRVLILVQLKDQVTKQPNMIPENHTAVHPFNKLVSRFLAQWCPVDILQTLPPIGGKL